MAVAVIPPPASDPTGTTPGTPNGAAPDPAAASLAALLAAMRRSLRRWIWVESLAWLGLGWAAGFWGVLAFDRLVEPPAGVRAALVAVAAVAAVVVVLRKLVFRLATPLGDETLALVIERVHPEFRDSLSTAIGLATGRDAAVAADLGARTTAEAAACVGGVRLRGLFQARRLSFLAAAALGGCLTTLGFVTLRPDLGAVFARRLVLLADEPWPRRVTLEAEGFPAGVRTVARGSDVDVRVRVRSADGAAAIVDLRHLDGGAWRTERMGERGGSDDRGQLFGHVLRSVVRDVPLEIRGGDARLRGLSLRVVEPPAVATIALRGRLPAYLGGGLIEPAVTRSVAVPRGTRLEIECRATKPLAAAMLAIRSAAAAADLEPAEQTIGTLDTRSPASQVLGGTIAALDADAALVVRLTDTDGLSNRDPLQCRFVAVPDAPPRVTLGPAGTVPAITPRGRLSLAGEISDDHGLAAATVRLTPVPAPRRPGAAGSEPAVRLVPLARVRGGETLVVVPVDRAEVVALEPLGLAAGDRLAVSVEAADASPFAESPQVGRSDTWTIDVVSAEQLQALLEAREVVLRRRFEGVIDDLAQSRDAFAATPVEAGRRLQDAAARAAGETQEIAGAFREVRAVFAANDLLSREQDQRLGAEIADPLATLAGGDLRRLVAACREPALPAGARAVLGQTDAVLAAMRAILARMLELESLNEVVERLRRVIQAQEELRAETLERQKQRVRTVLEEP